MPDMTVRCNECHFPILVPAGTRTYDPIKCSYCDLPISGEPVDVLERIGEWRREMAKELLAQNWESYLSGQRGDFAYHIARALRVADPINAEKIREAWPQLYAAWECRG